MDFGDDFSWFAILKEARQEQSSRTSKEDEETSRDVLSLDRGSRAQIHSSDFLGNVMHSSSSQIEGGAQVAHDLTTVELSMGSKVHLMEFSENEPAGASTQEMPPSEPVSFDLGPLTRNHESEISENMMCSSSIQNVEQGEGDTERKAEASCDLPPDGLAMDLNIPMMPLNINDPEMSPYSDYVDAIEELPAQSASVESIRRSLRISEIGELPDYREVKTRQPSKRSKSKRRRPKRPKYPKISKGPTKKSKPLKRLSLPLRQA